MKELAFHLLAHAPVESQRGAAGWARLCALCVSVAHLLLFAHVAARAAGLSPDETVKRLKPADGLEVKLAASEPTIRQPVNITFDERGRMWVLQYLQYPEPAGLKMLSRDSVFALGWNQSRD